MQSFLHGRYLHLLYARLRSALYMPQRGIDGSAGEILGEPSPPTSPPPEPSRRTFPVSEISAVLNASLRRSASMQ
jgi:hypothetical protein